MPISQTSCPNSRSLSSPGFYVWFQHKMSLQLRFIRRILFPKGGNTATRKDQEPREAWILERSMDDIHRRLVYPAFRTRPPPSGCPGTPRPTPFPSPLLLWAYNQIFILGWVLLQDASGLTLVNLETARASSQLSLRRWKNDYFLHLVALMVLQEIELEV